MPNFFHPLLQGGNLIAASIEDIGDRAIAFLTDNRLPKREPQLSHYVRVPDVAPDVLQSLRFLLPLVNNMATRYLLIETKNPSWVLLIHNHAKVRADLGLVAHLTKVLQTRGMGWNCREHTLRKQRDGEVTGHPGGSNFYTYENGDLVRSIDCVYDGTWRFAQHGAPYSFEHVARYMAPKRKDRLTCDMVKEYLNAFDVSPWETEFYRVTKDHPARGLEFVSEDSSMLAWLDPVPLDSIGE
jgi:hypothetical protein